MRRLFTTSVFVACAVAPLTASATDVQACLGASEKGQRARSAGKLREAQNHFLVCGGEGCPGMVRKDCAQWQTEVIAMLPSVVFGAKDKQGRDMFDVSVSMDGEVLVKKLDGKSVPVDPGPHTFKFEAVNVAPVVERALVKEGEKTRVITVSFADGSAAAAGDPAPTPGDPEKPAPTRGHTIYPWIVVGAGVATMIAGTVIILTAPALPAGCNQDSNSCAKDPTGKETAEGFRNRQETAGRHDAQPVEGLIVAAAGLAAVGAGLLWHFLEPTGDRTTGLRFTPWAAPSRSGGQAGVSLGASF